MQMSWRRSVRRRFNPGEAGREPGTRFSAPPPCSPAVGWLGAGGCSSAASREDGQIRLCTLAPPCSRTHLAAWLPACFCLSEHRLMRPIVLQEQGGPPVVLRGHGQAIGHLWVSLGPQGPGATLGSTSNFITSLGDADVQPGLRTAVVLGWCRCWASATMPITVTY